MQARSAGSHALGHFLLAVSALVLAVWGEWALFTQKLGMDGILLFAVALAAFAWTVLPTERLVASPPDTHTGAVPQRQSGAGSWKPLSLLVAATCALLAWTFSGGNRVRPETLIFWVASCYLYLRAFWVAGDAISPGPLERLRAVVRMLMAISWSVVGLLAVMVIGAFFRYYQIATVPSDPTSDIAEKLLDIRDLQNGQYHIFFPRNTGREPLEFYMALPFVQVLGLSHLALKVLTATVSLLAIPLVFLLGREISGPRFGLLAAFFLAISKWDVAIARVGLRFPYYPLFVALAFLFLLRALRGGRRNDYLLCGLATGIGLYGYSPFRAMVLLIPALVLVKVAFALKRRRDVIWPTLRNAGLCLGAVALAFIPMAHYMTEDPTMFWFRALTRVSSLETPLPPDPLRVLASNIVNALAMFNWRGDVVWVNTIPFDPVLDYVSGGLFVLGIGWCVYELFVRREPVAAYLLVGVFVLMLPSILSVAFPVENPSVVRTGGAGPLVALIVAAPVYLTGRRLAGLWPAQAGKTLTVALVALLMGLAARVSFDRYFVDYPVQYRESSINSTEMAAVIEGFSRSVGSHRNVFIKAWPYWVDTRNVAFNMGDPDWSNVLMTTEDVVKHQPPRGNKLYLLYPDDRDSAQLLLQRFPEGQLRVEKSATPGKDFLVFFVPGRE